MNRSTKTLVFYLALVFLSGAALGVLSYRYFVEGPAPTRAATVRPTPDEYRRMFKDEMRARVGINADQEAQLDRIMDATREKFRAFRESTKPQERALQADHVARVKAILTPEQQAEYDKLRAEREAKRKAEREAEEARRASEGKAK